MTMSMHHCPCAQTIRTLETNNNQTHLHRCRKNLVDSPNSRREMTQQLPRLDSIPEQIDGGHLSPAHTGGSPTALNADMKKNSQRIHHSNHRLSQPEVRPSSSPSPSLKCFPSAACPSSSIVVSILLPLLLVFLLPTLNLTKDSEPTEAAFGSGGAGKRGLPLAQPDGWDHIKTSYDLLYALVRFPLDRLRLGSGLITMTLANEISSKSDLQEEEQHHTHQMLVAPAEHRASYLAPAPSGYVPGGYHPDQATHRGPADMQPGADPQYGGPGELGPGTEPGMEGGGVAGPEPMSQGTSPSTSLQTRSDLPAVRALNVKCEKNHMTVNLVFDRPFYGLVFSKGHYNFNPQTSPRPTNDAITHEISSLHNVADQKCIHLREGSGQTSVNFEIHLGKCGMQSSDAGPGIPGQQLATANSQQQQPNGLYIENTIIIQYDPLVQEVYDQARKLRCTWYDYYEKSVTFRPYNVDMLDAVTANFLGDNIQCWMQIQVGKGPWSSEVTGIVKIGQTMTMVLAIKDDENRFDMLVRNCIAHDGKHPPIQLVDEYGCVARPKIMSKFQKIKNFGAAATVVSYAHFQAFKFPDSMSVHFQCVIQVCRYECPEPVCNSNGQAPAIADQTSGSGADYATSGTEIVASKEPVPVYHGNASSSHALKLDESQGRVQVKLDTSMMAGSLSGRTGPQVGGSRANNGPLPPHLLHMSAGVGPGSAAQPARITSGHSYMSSSYTGARQNPFVGPTTGGASSRQQMSSVSASLRQSVAPPSGTQAPVYYSPPYPQIRRAAYATNRIGELAPTDPQQVVDLDQAIAGEAAPPDLLTSNPLSLIALPRGLRMAPLDKQDQLPTGTTAILSTTLPQPLPLYSSTAPAIAHPSNHRYRRAVVGDKPSDQLLFLAGAANGSGNQNYATTNDTSGGRRQRALPSSNGDSTAIRTQKTIQVVSPDDVAFSLLADELGGEPPVTLGGAGKWSSSNRRPLHMSEDLNTVCFSAGRLMAVILVTFGAVASGVVIAAYVIFRQRSQLEEKLSSVYEVDNVDQRGQRHLSAETIDQQQYTMTRNAADLIARRQHEELQQRNSYLARLYSQFAPASYWR